MSPKARIITMHSFRHGVGKSTITANLAAVLALRGMRVCVVDADLRLPGLHLFFQTPEDAISLHLNDYLESGISLEHAVIDVSARLPLRPPGKLFFIPASTHLADIAKAIRLKLDLEKINLGFQQLALRKNIELFLVDITTGLNEDNLAYLAAADTLIAILQPDQPDFQGTAVTLDIARRLEIPQTILVVNLVSDKYDIRNVTEQVEAAYNCKVGAVLPSSEDILALASQDLIVIRNPSHPFAATLYKLAERI